MPWMGARRPEFQSGRHHRSVCPRLACDFLLGASSRGGEIPCGCGLYRGEYQNLPETFI